MNLFDEWVNLFFVKIGDYDENSKLVYNIINYLNITKISLKFSKVLKKLSFILNQKRKGFKNQ